MDFRSDLLLLRFIPKSFLSDTVFLSTVHLRATSPRSRRSVQGLPLYWISSFVGHHFLSELRLFSMH